MIHKRENREFFRSIISAKVEVRLSTGVLVEGKARNISLKGVWFSTKLSLPVGSLVRVTVLLDDGKMKRRIEGDGRVVRIDEGGVALQFNELDEDSTRHLQELLSYSQEEMDQLRRPQFEMATNGGAK